MQTADTSFPPADDGDEDDTLSYFARLAKES